MRWVHAPPRSPSAVLLASCRFIPTAEVDGAGATPALIERRGVVRSRQDGRLDLGDEGRSLFREEGGPVRRGARPCRQIARRGRRQVRLSRQVRGHAVDAHGQVRRRRSSPPTPSRAPRPSASTRPVRARPTRSVQIGPAMRGTAIRDALDFVSFNDFTNQIDFARYRQGVQHLRQPQRRWRSCRAKTWSAAR